MPEFENSDLAFRPPSGGSADDTRNAFERTDARIKRALSNISAYSAAVDSSLTGLGTSINVVAADLVSTASTLQSSINVVAGSVTTVNNDLQAWKGAFSTRFSASFGTAMGSVFTTASNPGFAQVTELGAAAGDFIMIGTSTKIPRWQAKANFVKYTVGLEIPTAFAAPSLPYSNNYGAWVALGLPPNDPAVISDMYVMSSHFDSLVNNLSTIMFNLIAALKTAKVLN